jgi:predicted amidophosphoribosyltransferase
MPLGELSAEERARVVDGAFAVRAGREWKITGRRVLLIDDVLTSGATCAACTRVLLAAGAASVDVLVAARVPDPRLR